MQTPSTNLATLAGGCFWCLEAVFVRLRGVESVQSGYCGGHTPEPNYREICTGESGHAEAVQIRFNPAVISYRDLLEVFFAIHDPTTPDRQGHDVGSQYRSAIFTHTQEQAQAAHEVIAALDAAHLYAAPIVTEVTAADVFHPAEEYHQDYFELNPYQAYCMTVVGPKVTKFMTKFAARLK